MYAIFQSGGKQHRVTEGQTLRLEKLNATTGDLVEFKHVLMIVDGNNCKIGTPTISGGLIKAKMLSHGRGKKIKIVKFHRRKHYRKNQGHRQYFTDIKVIEIIA